MEAGPAAGRHRPGRRIRSREAMAVEDGMPNWPSRLSAGARRGVRRPRPHRRSRRGRDVPAIDLVGQTDLLMLMGVLSHCRALVANDSGALHLAAALGVPVAGIYGPTDERYSTPLASVEGAQATRWWRFRSRCSAGRAFWQIVRSTIAA